MRIPVRLCGEEAHTIPTEDAPAPMALHSFKTRVSDGKIHVTANPSHTLKENKDRQSKLLGNGIDGSGRGTVIIGGGSGAFNAVESLREVRHEDINFC